jgi:type II secretory pathway component PulC
MAAPNIVNVSTIYGRTALQVVTATMANVVVNAANSGTVVKLNDVMVSNFSTTAITTNVVVGRGASVFYLAGTMTVPANSALMVIAKDTVIYMEEGDYLQCNASSATSSHITASYEIIS